MDVAFTLNATGKLTFAKNASSNFYIDERGVYAIFATLAAEKGRYGWDSTVGTFFSTIRKDGRLTATRLNSAASDALEQCRRDGIISAGATSQPERASAGKWALLLKWRTPGGAAVTERGQI